MSLTLQRIFGDPDLNGPAPLQLKLSPNGKQVSYLKAAEEDFERLNLWVYDIDQANHALLVDSRALSNSRVLSDAEKARRERLRISQSGIVEYFWSPTSEALLFPVEGNLFLVDLASDEAAKQITDSSTFETDITFSPDGRRIAFVRDQNLHTIDLSSSEVTQLTTEGGDLVSCGLAEFIAQEEMHRYRGYWWSPDSEKIAYTRVDESTVEVSQRYEIDADHFGVFDQRYPFAGKSNAAVSVGVVSLVNQITTWLDLDTEHETYLARVNWFRDSQNLAVQRQTRNQQQLELLRCSCDGSVTEQLLTETSDSWLNLNDNFTPLTDNRFIWGSERSGFNHLYLYGHDGELQSQLTDGDWVVDNVSGVTDSQVFFTGYRDTPLEKHLYTVSLNGSTPQRITAEGFTHVISLSSDCQYYVDRFSNAVTPPAVNLCKIDGSVFESLEANPLKEGHPFFPFIKQRGSVQFDQIEAEDGQTLHYRLIKPSSDRLAVNGKSPLILTVYGGPGVQRVNNEWLPAWNHYMAAQGYGLLQLDNRGTANRGVKFESPIYRHMGEVEVQDQLRGIQHVSQFDWVDGDRLAAFGHSYGGYMTLMLLMKSDRFRAGISVAPVTDWGLYDTHYTERFLSHPDENAEGYKKSSVFPYVKSLKGKLLVIHGMADDNVLFSNSTKLYKALQDINADFEIMNYPGAKHGLTGRSVNIHRYSLMDRFFSQHLATS